MKEPVFVDLAVKQIFDNFPSKVRKNLLFIRSLVFEIADENACVGELQETLKWESPSYITHSPKVGTTLRLSKVRSEENKIALSVHCQSSLIGEFKAVYPELEYDGNRSLIFDVDEALPVSTIEHFISLALTYHYRKKRGIGL